MIYKYNIGDLLYNIGDLLVSKHKGTKYYPQIGYIIKLQKGEYIVKWFIRDDKHIQKGYYLPEQLKNYIHFPVKE